MPTAKTIQIYIPDGNPRSVKLAEITSRTIMAIQIPRAKLEYAFSRKELQNVAVYYLIGDADEEGKPLVYVGETEENLARLKRHNKLKDFWNVAIILVSKTQHFTKTHVKYLEAHSCSEVVTAGRYKIENQTSPTKPHISEPMEADLLDNFLTIKTLVSTLGYPLFDEISKPEEYDILTCRCKNAVAQGEYTEDGLIVFKDSTCVFEDAPSAGSWVKGSRQKLIEAGILVQSGDVYIFTEDYIFSSPSAAASVIVARHANGWTEWKYEDGRTLDDVKRQNPEE